MMAGSPGDGAPEKYETGSYPVTATPASSTISKMETTRCSAGAAASVAATGDAVVSVGGGDACFWQPLAAAKAHARATIIVVFLCIDPPFADAIVSLR
jgi:hypothetical protein